MAFTDDDKIVIKFLRQNKHYADSLRKSGRWLHWNDWFERSMRLGWQNERKVGLAADHEQRERCTTLIALTSLHSVRKTSPALIQHREWLAVQICCTYIIVKYRDITRTLYLTIDSQLVGAGFFGSRCKYSSVTADMLLELGLPSFNTIMSVLLTGCQRATMFLFNVFCSLTCNVHLTVLFVSFFTRFLRARY